MGFCSPTNSSNKSLRRLRDIPEDLQVVEVEPKFLQHGTRFRVSDFTSNLVSLSKL